MMKNLCLFALICAASLNADGFSELDQDLIAGKDFPFPPGEEADMPQADEDDNNAGKDYPFPKSEQDDPDTSPSCSQSDNSCQDQSQKKIVPEANQPPGQSQ